MGYYQKEFTHELKIDKSIVTEADKAADIYIVTELQKLFPGIPTVSEEGAKDRKGSDTFFLIDPIDGTSGFVKGRGEWTVNIGLIEDRRATCGVIYIPVTNELFYADGKKSYKSTSVIASEARQSQEEGTIRRLPRRVAPRNDELQEIHCRQMPDDGIIVLGSKDHRDTETLKAIETLKTTHPNLSVTAAASSLKFCRIAEGAADYYPRFSRTMEWDTAAGQAILQCAGGSVTTPDGSEFLYGKRDDWENGSFIARGLIK